MTDKLWGFLALSRTKMDFSTLLENTNFRAFFKNNGELSCPFQDRKVNFRVLVDFKKLNKSRPREERKWNLVPASLKMKCEVRFNKKLIAAHT